MSLQILQPPGWAKPKGYSNGVAGRGKLIFVGGQIGWNAEQQFTTARFSEQVHIALQNIVAVLREAGAGPEHVVRLTWYITSRDEYYEQMKEVGAAYREVMGRNYPSMAMVQVVALMEAQAKVEIEATAVVPE